MSDQDEFLRKIVQYLNDPQNGGVKHDIDLLIRQSPQNKFVYDQVFSIWNNSSDQQKLKLLDKDEAVSAIESKLAGLPHIELISNGHTKKWFNLNRWALTAAAAVLLGVLVFWSYTRYLKTNTVLKITQNTIDSVTLADGSKIYLDYYSALSYPDKFKDATREISLIKGQAFFKIHRDTTHPFVVQINHSSVTVLGTSFNINKSDNKIVLNVNTGKVKFRPSANEAEGSILFAGTGIVYYETEGKQVILNSFDHNDHAWLTHQLYFVDASLTDVCKQLESYYKVKIALAGNISAFKKFNATFKDNKLSEIMDVLKETYPIKIERLDDTSIVVQSIK
ncbi:FecR family protein [Mucilaginibacter sp. AW1-3]